MAPVLLPFRANGSAVPLVSLGSDSAAYEILPANRKIEARQRIIFFIGLIFRMKEEVCGDKCT
jgi:hypothetical protein